MPDIEKLPYLKAMIDSWPERIRKLGLNRGQVADKAGVSAPHLSCIINMKIKSPRQDTLNAIEMVLVDCEAAHVV